MSILREAMITNRHSGFIQPQAPEIGPVAANILESMQERTPENSGAVLSATLEYLWRSFQRTEVKGLITTGESIRTGRGNCFSLSCLVASALRRLGTPEHAVAVFIGCPKAHPDLVHAYVLTLGKEPGYVAVVEPELMKAMDFPLEEFWAKYRIYCLFNDRFEVTSRDEERVWLLKLVQNSNGVSGPEAGTVAGKAATTSDSQTAAKKSVQWIAYGAVNQACRDIFQQLTTQNESDSSAEFLATLDAQYRARIAVVPAAVTAQLTRIAIDAAQNYFKIISSEMDAIHGLARCFRHSGKQLEWTDLAHIVIAGLLVDLGVREQLLRTATIKEQPDDFWIWGFEGGTGARNSFGIRLQEGEGKGAVFFELWHCRSKRPQMLKIDTRDIRLLKSMSEGRLGEVSDLSSEDQHRAIKLAFYRLCSKTNGTYTANIPVLAEPGAEAVHGEISRIAGLLTSQAVMPALEEADKIYALEFSASPADIFRHAFARLLMEHAMDRLIEGNALPAFPLQPDYGWGCWLSWKAHEQRF